ncbi:MAG TPA: ABC transporter permease [Acidimicrobiales bacterium]|jgi:ABC-2 type transport system permease protein/oleandomycin transport system permease protein|nr:ABC transporter permease [Acidimicrobiales bacterium]
MGTAASAATVPSDGTSLAHTGGNRMAIAVADGLTVTWRNLIGYIRIPEAMFFSSIQPIMFVLLFRYVFGGAIHIPGFDYVDFLLPGIFVQTVMFGAIGTAIGLAEDLQKGLIERFRSLPMAHSAVLAGRTTADLVRNVFVVLLMTAVGYLVGFNVHTNVLLFLAGFALLLAFGYALCWGFTIVGLTAPNSETAQLMSFPILFPFTFASSAFVRVETMPGWLQAFARNQPVTALVDATRALMLGGPTTEPLAKAILWTGGLLLALVPLAVHRYRKVA